MSRKIEKLRPGTCYHIHNRGNNGGTVFFRRSNCRYFLRLFDQYVRPVSDVYAWCLTENEFHFLLRTKSLEQMKASERSYATVVEVKTLSASYQFSHLLNSYTQAVNRQMRRTGSLFEKPFRRKAIGSQMEFESCLSRFRQMAANSAYGYDSLAFLNKNESGTANKSSTC
jgi:hypothetical protein